MVDGMETPKSMDEITNDAMRQLLTVDNLIIEDKPPMTHDELTAYNYVKDNFTYTEDGRPMTAIPFNEQQIGRDYEVLHK